MFWDLVLIIFGITIALYGFLSLIRDAVDYFFPIKALHPSVEIHTKEDLESLPIYLDEASALWNKKVNYPIVLCSSQLLEGGQLPLAALTACMDYGAECLIIDFEGKEEEEDVG